MSKLYRSAIFLVSDVSSAEEEVLRRLECFEDSTRAVALERLAELLLKRARELRAGGPS